MTICLGAVWALHNLGFVIWTIAGELDSSKSAFATRYDLRGNAKGTVAHLKQISQQHHGEGLLDLILP